MRDHVLCSKLKLDKKTDENQCLINELSDMKKFCDCLEQENQKLKSQIEYERTKNDECMKLKTLVDIELEKSLDKLRTQRYEYESKLSILDESLKSSQKQYHILQRTMDDKHEKEIQELKQHIHQLEMKIEEVIKDKALVSIRCGELIEENRRLEKALNDKEDDYEEKINGYKEKNSSLSTQIEEIEKQLTETKKQLEFITIEKDETLADMLIAVRVASELRYGRDSNRVRRILI
jgi:chromosome segregation ATPase